MRALRIAGLLRLADTTHFHRQRRRVRDANRVFVDANPDFPLPPAKLAFDAYVHIDWAGYRASGELQAAAVAEVIAAAFPSAPIRSSSGGAGRDG